MYFFYSVITLGADSINFVDVLTVQVESSRRLAWLEAEAEPKSEMKW